LSFLGFLVSFLRSIPFAIEKSPFDFDYASARRILSIPRQEPAVAAWSSADGPYIPGIATSFIRR
jgi:hypothetical protein